MVNLFSSKAEISVKTTEREGLYPTTIWSEIGRIQEGDEETTLESLNNLITTYYVPLKLHLVSKFKVSEEQASEWLQDFVWKKVLLKNLVANADQAKGKFRSFLLNTLDRFVISELRKRRSNVVALEDISEGEIAGSGMDASADPMDLAWARTVMVQALQQMQAHCEQTERGKAIWQVFLLRLYAPLLENKEPIPYKELVDRLGFRNDVEAGNALITAKRMFQRFLRTVIGRYLKHEADINKEIRQIIAIFGSSA